MAKKTTASLIDSMNQLLALLIDLKLRTKQAHWNVEGENFIAIHELFDKIAGDTDEYADLIAERIRQLGGLAHGTLQSVSKGTILSAYPLNTTESKLHIKLISEALAIASVHLRKLIDVSDEVDDPATADICTEIVRGIDKYHWFLVSHLK